MSLNLSKGQKLNLSKDSGSTLKNIKVALGWDARSSRVSGNAIDLDVSVLLLNENGKVDISEMNDNNCESFCFYNNVLAGRGKVKHSGDNRNGDSDGDDETVDILLSEMDVKYKKLLVLVTSESGDKFGDVSNAYVRMIDNENNKELLRFDLDFEASTATGVQFASIINRNNSWFFSADQKEFVGGLDSILNEYGVDTTR